MSTDKKQLLTKGGEVLIDSDVNKDEDKQIQQLYALSTKINAAGDGATKLENEYLGILNGVKGGKRAKMLASQLIPKYLKYFPQKTAPAIDALLDLCEEELIDVRISAIRVLPLICQDSPGNVSQISNVLGQLLLADQPLELAEAKRSFTQLLNIDAKASLGSLFQHIATKDEEGLHTKALEFLNEKVIPSLGVLKPEVEDFISKEVQKLVSTSSENEFKIFIEILKNLKVLQTNEGKKELIQIIATGLTDKPKKDDILKVLNTMPICIPIFEKMNLQSSSFYNFLVSKGLSQIDKLDDKTILKILKTLAELSVFVTTSDARNSLSTIYSILLKYLPNKPKEDEPEPLFNFSYVECLLFVFLQLAKKAPGALNPICGIKIITGQPQDSDMTDYSNKLLDFQTRLEYLKVQSKNFVTNIETQKKSIQKKDTDTPDEKKAKVAKEQQLTMATKLIQNIMKMSGMLLLKKPTFEVSGSVHLSWKPAPKKRQAGQVENLKNPDAKKKKKNKKVQQPTTTTTTTTAGKKKKK